MKEGIFTAKQVGERIKERRTELHCTMEMLGDELGVNKSTIQRYESKGVDPKKNYILLSIAEALDTTVEWLTGQSDERELDTHTRLKSELDKHISEYINDVTSYISDEKHQELVTDLLISFIDMFSVFSYHFGKAQTEIEKAENDADLKELLMKYALNAADISEKVYRQEMEQPISSIKDMVEQLLHIYDAHDNGLVRLFEIRNNAQKNLKKTIAAS